MRNLKKVLAVVLALVMILGTVTIAAAATTTPSLTSFTDAASVAVKNREAVDVLTGLGVLAGYADGSFKPAQTITRAEAAKIIAYLKLGSTAAELLPKTETGFVDVPATHWASSYIAYGQAEKLLLGEAGGKFNPQNTLTTGQFLALLLRVAGYGKKNELQGSAWLLNAVQLANTKGIFQNDDKTTVNVNAGGTREDLARFSFNLLTRVALVDYVSTLDVYVNKGNSIFTPSDTWTTQGLDVFSLTYNNTDNSGYLPANLEIYDMDYATAARVLGGMGHSWLVKGKYIAHWYPSVVVVDTFVVNQHKIKDLTSKYNFALDGTTVGKDPYTGLPVSSYSTAGVVHVLNGFVLDPAGIDEDFFDKRNGEQFAFSTAEDTKGGAGAPSTPLTKFKSNDGDVIFLLDVNDFGAPADGYVDYIVELQPYLAQVASITKIAGVDYANLSVYVDDKYNGDTDAAFVSGRILAGSYKKGDWLTIVPQAQNSPTATAGTYNQPQIALAYDLPIGGSFGAAGYVDLRDAIVSYPATAKNVTITSYTKLTGTDYYKPLAVTGSGTKYNALGAHFNLALNVWYSPKGVDGAVILDHNGFLAGYTASPVEIKYVYFDKTTVNMVGQTVGMVDGVPTLYHYATVHAYFTDGTDKMISLAFDPFTQAFPAGSVLAGLNVSGNVGPIDTVLAGRWFTYTVSKAGTYTINALPGTEIEVADTTADADITLGYSLTTTGNKAPNPTVILDSTGSVLSGNSTLLTIISGGKATKYEGYRNFPAASTYAYADGPGAAPVDTPTTALVVYSSTTTMATYIYVITPGALPAVKPAIVFRDRVYRGVDDFAEYVTANVLYAGKTGESEDQKTYYNDGSFLYPADLQMAPGDFIDYNTGAQLSTTSSLLVAYDLEILQVDIKEGYIIATDGSDTYVIEVSGDFIAADMISNAAVALNRDDLAVGDYINVILGNYGADATGTYDIGGTLLALVRN
jgi:hypothetical protein